MTIARRPGEPLLGNPDVSGKVLSSTTAGVRSWVGIIDADHRAAVTGVHGIVAKGANLRSVGLGISALAASTSDSAVAIGYNAANAATTANVVAVGTQACAKVTTGHSVGIGALAASNATTGFVTAVGYVAAAASSAGNTTAVGYYAANQVTTGACTAVGAQAAQKTTTGGITAIGNLAAWGNTTGTGGTFIGGAAGSYLADGSTDNTISNYGVYIGTATKASAAGATNEIVIGYNAIGGGSNTVRLGNASVTAWLPGATNKVALGNASTAFKELYMTDGTNNWKLTVDATGPVWTSL